MPEEQDPEPTPETPEEPEVDEDEEAWERLSGRLRGLFREELDEADKRRAAAAPEPAAKSDPEPAPAPTKETPQQDDQRPRRTAYDRWFGTRRRT